jgi:hypothetical protein
VKHGPRLTQKEYEQAIVSLYRDAPQPGSPRDEAGIRRRELDLNIDYRLGTRFPPERREALWRVQQTLEKRRLRLAASWVASLFARQRTAGQAKRLASFVIQEYAKVLDADELARYFGEEEVANPGLPMDGP